MKIVEKHEVILDARQPLNWIDQVLEEVHECYQYRGESPTKIVVTAEQLSDMRRQLARRRCDLDVGSLEPPRLNEPPTLWGVPVEVEE